MRPGRVAVREVVGPHAVVGAPPRQYVAADGVVEESCVDLAVEVLAGKFFQREAIAVDSMALKIIVPLLQDKRNPADLVFDQDQLQSREALQRSGEDQLIQAVNRLKQFLIDAVTLPGEAAFLGRLNAEGAGSAVAVAAQDLQ